MNKIIKKLFLLALSGSLLAVVSCQKNNSGDIAIMGKGKADKLELTNYFLKRNSKISRRFVLKLAGIYIQESSKEGVNSDVAFCQMCLETNFLRYGNQVKPGQNNFAGIGATDNGASGAVFKTVRLGVRAQVQHLKAYASNASLRMKLVDPRFKYVKRGSAVYVSQLGNGKWASDPDYSKKMLTQIHNLLVT